MASNSNQKSGSSGRSTNRKRVVIGARETVRVRYSKGQPEVEATPKQRPSRPKERSAGSRLAEARRQDRERRQASIRRRRVGIGIGIALLLALAAWGLVRLTHSDAFAVTDVEVVGTSEISKADVVRLAAVPTGSTLIDVNREAIAQRIEGNPWVAAVSVDRDFPHTLVVKVTERTPGAWVNVSKRSGWMVSTDATWLRPRSKSESLTLPLVTDVEGLRPEIGKPASSEEIENALEDPGFAEPSAEAPREVRFRPIGREDRAGHQERHPDLHRSRV